jgi:hypothetical protein
LIDDRIIPIYYHAVSFNFMKKRLNSVVRVIPFISELFEKTSRQVMGSHGHSCHVRGITRTKWGLHSYAQLCKLPGYNPALTELNEELKRKFFDKIDTNLF